MKQSHILPSSITVKCYAAQKSPLLYEIYDNKTGKLFSVMPMQKAFSFLTTFDYKWVVGSNGVWEV